MLNNFDKQSQKVIVTAESIAFDLGCSEVKTIHLLLSILKDDKSILKKYLNDTSSGEIHYHSIMKDVKRIYGSSNIQPFYMEYSEKTKKIFESLVNKYKKKQKKIPLFEIERRLLQNDCTSSEILKKYINDMNQTRKSFDKYIYSQSQTKSQTDTNIIQSLFDEKKIFYASVLSPKKEKVILERDKEVANVMVGLSCQQKPNIALTGEAGVGKSAVVEEIARVLCHENPYLHLKDYIIVKLDLNTSIAGTKYRGEFEEKIQKYLDVIKNEKVITFIDEGHQISRIGASEGSVSIGEIIKPLLARGDYHFIIATTSQEYQFIQQDNALNRRFRRINIEEPSIDKVYPMIKNAVHRLSKFHHINIEEKDVKNCIKKCQDIKNRYFPDKILDTLDYAMSYMKCNQIKEFPEEFVNSYIESMKENG